MINIIKNSSVLNKVKTHIHNNPLNKLGIYNPSKVYYNLSYNELLKHEINNNEGQLL